MNRSRRLLMRGIGYLTLFPFFSLFSKKVSSAPNELTEKVKNREVKKDESELPNQISCLEDIYSFVPRIDGQLITLKHAIKSGPLLNSQLFYDKDDTVSTSDGYSVFVSHDKLRWKADVSNGVDVRLAGLLSDGSNLGSCINKIILGEIAKVKAGKSIFECVTTIYIPAKFDGRANPNYILDEPIVLPSFFCLKTNGFVYISVPDNISYAIKVTNDILDFSTNTLDKSPTDIQGCKTFDAGGGRFVFSGSGSHNSTTGLYIGNQRKHSFAVRDLLINDITLQYFENGIEFAPNNNFINTFDKINVVMCKYGFLVSAVNSVSAGEKIVFNDCVFGNNDIAHFRLSAQVNYYIINCSLDYTGQHVFFIDETCALSRLIIDKGHIEGVPQYLVYCPKKLPLPLKIQFRDVMLYMNGAIYNSMRQLIFSPEGNCHIIFDGCDWTFINYYEHSPYISLAGYSDETDINNRIVINNPLPRVTGLRSNCILPQYKSSLLGAIPISHAKKGASALNKIIDSSNVIFISETSDVEIIYGDIDDDNAQIIEVISYANDTVVDLISAFYHSGSIGSFWSGGCSIELVDVKSKHCNMFFIIDSYNENYKKVINLDEYKDAKNNIVESYFSDVIDLNKIFSTAKYAKKHSGFIGVWQSVNQSKCAITFQPKIRIQDFKGKIRVKLPVFWCE